jgi:hypothetical protein
VAIKAVLLKDRLDLFVKFRRAGQSARRRHCRQAAGQEIDWGGLRHELVS